MRIIESAEIKDHGAVLRLLDNNSDYSCELTFSDGTRMMIFRERDKIKAINRYHSKKGELLSDD